MRGRCQRWIVDLAALEHSLADLFAVQRWQSVLGQEPFINLVVACPEPAYRRWRGGAGANPPPPPHAGAGGGRMRPRRHPTPHPRVTPASALPCGLTATRTR